MVYCGKTVGGVSEFRIFATKWALRFSKFKNISSFADVRLSQWEVPECTGAALWRLPGGQCCQGRARDTTPPWRGCWAGAWPRRCCRPQPRPSSSEPSSATAVSGGECRLSPPHSTLTTFPPLLPGYLEFKLFSIQTWALGFIPPLKFIKNKD